MRGVGGHDGVDGPGQVDHRHGRPPDQGVEGAGDGGGPEDQEEAVGHQSRPQHQYANYIAPKGNQGTEK